MTSSAIKIVSNPTKKQQILYLVESNPAVDDVASRLRDLADKNGLSHKEIIRAHTLKDEKTEVYKYFDHQGQPQQRFQVSDAFVAQFTALDYLRSISLEHQATRTRGDPCQIL